MLYQKLSRICPFLKDKFIKEAYLGTQKILGFDTNNTLSTYGEDERFQIVNYDKEYGDFYAGGYAKLNAVCTKFGGGVINIWDPGGSYNLVDIYIKNIVTGAQLFRYRVSVSAYKSLSDFTLKFEVFDANDKSLASNTWRTDYGFSSSFRVFEYDFTNNKWLFDLIYTGSYSSGRITTHSVSSPYVPCKVEVYNISGRNGARFRMNNIVVQN